MIDNIKKDFQEISEKVHAYPQNACTDLRKLLEYILDDQLTSHNINKGKDLNADINLLRNTYSVQTIESMHYVRKIGNYGSHNANVPVNSANAKAALEAMVSIITEVYGEHIKPVKKSIKAGNAADAKLFNTISQVIEESNCWYLLKEHDFHADFEKAYYRDLVELVHMNSKPTFNFYDNEINKSKEELINSITGFYHTIAFKTFPQGHGLQTVDDDDDTAKMLNNYAEEILDKYNAFVEIARNNMDI